MSMPIDLRVKVDDYLAERRRLGFELRNMALALASFARYTEHVGHQGPLTTDVMADWARQDKAQSHSLGTWAGWIAEPMAILASTICAIASLSAG
jgi:hypothetical protein